MSWFPKMNKILGHYLKVTTDVGGGAPWGTMNASHEVFTVTGLVKMLVVPEITESVTYTGPDTWTWGDELHVDNIVGSSDHSEMTAGNLWTVVSPAAAGDPTHHTLNWEAFTDLFAFMNYGLDIGYAIPDGAGNPSAGIIDWHCRWWALSPGGLVVAGAGGTL